jgi:hypothetical protein
MGPTGVTLASKVGSEREGNKAETKGAKDLFRHFSRFEECHYFPEKRNVFVIGVFRMERLELGRGYMYRCEPPPPGEPYDN